MAALAVSDCTPASSIIVDMLLGPLRCWKVRKWIASAVLDKILHHSTAVNIRGESYRLREKKSGLFSAKK